MNSKILLAVPFEKTRAKLEQFLKENSFDVDFADNGKEAQIKIYKNKFAAVILDLDTQDYPGMQVLRYIKHNFSTLKVVVIAQTKERFEELGGDVKTLRKLGASDIFVEPIPLKMLMKGLAGNRQASAEGTENAPVAVQPSKETEVRLPDNKFTKILVDEFFSNNVTVCNIFIRLEKNNYLRLLQRGEVFDQERIEKHRKERNFDSLYILAEDRLLYITYITSLIEGIIKNNGILTLKKIFIFKTMVEQYIEEVYVNGMRPQLVEEGKKISLALGQFAALEKNLGPTLKIVDKFTLSTYTHPFLTTLFSATMAKNVPWVSPTSLPHALMGAMFHDIGLVKIPAKIAQKPHEKMTPPEWEEFKKHPLIGRDLLGSCANLAEPVRQIVTHHHEYSDSSGFPAGLSDAKIYPPAKIISMANFYVDFFVEGNHSPLVGLQKLVSNPDHVKKFNPEIIKALVGSFSK